MALASLPSLPAAAAVPFAQTCLRAEPSELGGNQTHRRVQMERIPRLIQAVVESAKRIILTLLASLAMEISLAKLTLPVSSRYKVSPCC